VDAIIAGEVREWETAEYVRDKITSGEKKTAALQCGKCLWGE